MRVGVSTACLFPQLTERALDELLAIGISTVEVFLNTPGEAEESFGRALRRQADAAGAQIVSVHPCSSEYEGVSFFGRYERRFGDAAEQYKRLFALCNVLGADILAFHGARSFLPIEPALYFERYAQLSAVAHSFGVRLCQENVVRFRCGDPDFVRALVRAVPDADLLLDVKQAIRAGIDPLEMLDAMGKNVRHVHISDHDAQRDCLAPGNGVFDYRGFAQRLQEVEFEGTLMIELYRRNFDRISRLAESEKLLTEILRVL